MVSQQTIKSLHFDIILQKLGEYCSAEDTCIELKKIYPYTNKNDVQKVHKQMLSISKHIQKEPLPHCSYVPSLECIFTMLKNTTVTHTLFCNEEELSLLRCVMESIYKCAQWANQVEDVALRTELFPHKSYTQLCDFFDVEGKIIKSNIPELVALEKKKARSYKLRQKTAKEFLQKNADMCVSEVPVFRADRTVLILSASYKTKVEGIIHGSSASDKSIYVEIPELYALNNEAQELLQEEHRIMYTVFLNISKTILQEKAVFVLCYEAFLEFDRLCAQYRYGRLINGSLISYDNADDNRDCDKNKIKKWHIYLPQARHPLISNCIALCIKMDIKEQQLVLVGPNAGGKTVALLTVGLLSLMNQSGIPIPVDNKTQPHNFTGDTIQECVLPMFSSVVIVIGDEQSVIEGNSTFFSHMLRVQECLEILEKKSYTETKKNILFLFDELCSGTDDQEGGALACAILDYCTAHSNLHLNTTIILSTHLTLVKQYAIQNEHVQIATLENTELNDYYINYTFVGGSEASRSAKKAGITQSILDHQKKILSEIGNNYYGVLQSLQKVLLENNKVKATLYTQKEEYDKRITLLWCLQDELEKKEAMLMKKNIAQGFYLLSNMRSKIEKATELLMQIKNYSHKPDQLHLEKQIKDMRIDSLGFEKNMQELQNAVLQKQKNIGRKSVALKVGDTVIVKSYGLHKNIRGEIISINCSASGDTYRVRAGIFVINLLREDLDKIEKDKEASYLSKVKVVSDVYIDDDKKISSVDVRGCSADEAIQIVNKHIDKAIILNVAVFSVVHGKGEGILMNAIFHMLQENPAVTKHQHASPSDGGAGKTYVYLT